MKHESHYIIHPATLDGCLQLSFIAAQHGRSSNMHRGYLPVRVRSMTMWNSAIPKDDFAIVEGEGHLRGLRSVDSSFKLVTMDGNPLVEAVVVFVSVEGGFAAAKEDVPSQPYQRLLWLPDIDQLHGSMTRAAFVNLDGATTTSFSMDNVRRAKDFMTSLGSVAGRGRQNLDILEGDLKSLKLSPQNLSYVASLMSPHKLVKLIAFKAPGARILEVGVNCGLTSATIISAAGGNLTYPAYDTYTFSSSSAEVTETAEVRFKTCNNVKSSHIAFDEDFVDRGFQEDSIDLLVITNPPSGPASFAQILKRLRPLLTGSGRLIIFTDQEDLSLEAACLGTRPDLERPAAALASTTPKDAVN